ncbi:MAG: NYN domain-containing protein [Ignavibacteriaceae bacterium]|nr:NYN domain-containing protein [Ignavibacteriaceae bacterium]
MKIYLIDGNNLMLKLRRTAALWKNSKQGSRELLVSILLESPQLRKAKVKIFFDGAENGRISSGTISLHYSGSKTADFFIRREIEQIKNPKLTSVISSDHEIMNLAKVCLCTVVTSEEFSRSLEKESEDTSEESKINALSRENDEIYQLLSRKKKPE